MSSKKGVKTAVVSHAQGPFVKSCESGALLRSGLRLAFGLALALSGCAHGVPAAHALRIADNADPDSLNPLLLHDQDTIGYALLYCQTLVGLDTSNRLVPVLITRLPTRSNGDISADGRALTYRLRRNVRFADGSVLTSADVAFTYRAIIDSRNNVLSQDVYRRIRNVTTPNPYTVVVRLKRPWNAAPAVLFAQADFAFGILPHRAFATSQVTHSAWNEHPYGTGPFRVVEWRRGDRVVLERNPYFSPRPRLARIELKMFPNPESGFVALRAREVDVAYVTPDALERARALRGVRILRTPENATIWLTLQTRKRPTDDLHVRRAIALAVDREAIAKTFHHAFPAASSFLPPVLGTYFDPSVHIATPNVRAANAELESAGWRWHGGLRAKGGLPLEGTFVLVAGHVVDVRVATVVQQELAQIGMRVAIKSFATAVFNALNGPIRNGRFTLAEDGWLGGADPEQSIVFTCVQANVDGNNISRYCNPRFDALASDQATTTDSTRRRRDFIHMQQIVNAALPVVPLYYESYDEGIRERVHGFARNMLRFPVSPETWDVRP